MRSCEMSLNELFANLQIINHVKTPPSVTLLPRLPHCYVPSTVITDAIIDRLIKMKKSDTDLTYSCKPVSWEPQRAICQKQAFHTLVDARDHIRSRHWTPEAAAPNPEDAASEPSAFFCLACGNTFPSEQAAQEHVDSKKADNLKCAFSS
ncbi:hypothetical protein K439DRAFT_1662747 [Ramaria rubella]|nr:hypothetical protein K439DRAFT_1662747 [Ramaria rubella]